MNNRERLLAILNHQPPDRIPWIPRLLLWYNAKLRTHSMPAKYEGLSLREIEHALNVGTPARDGRVYRTEYEKVDVLTREEGNRRITEYHTPVGSVRTVMHFTAELDALGLPGRVEEHLLKTPNDYRIWSWIEEHTNYFPAYDDYTAYDIETGDDGLPMIAVGDVPFHSWAQQLAGYEQAFLHLVDFPDEVERLLAVISEVERAKMWPIVLDSPARLLLHGVHLSSQFTPPRLFSKYIIPYYDQIMPFVHEKGMAVAMHADNDVSAIVEHIERAGWDMVECFVTEPMVPMTLERARTTWGTRVTIWGGLPSLLLSPSVSESDFQGYVLKMLQTIAPGDAFILGVADNVMPDSLIERIAWVSEILEERGRYPLAGR